MKLVSALAAVVALALGVAATATAGVWPTAGKASLHGVPPSADARGRAVIEIQPRHAVVGLDGLRGLPGTQPRGFVIWLATDRSEGAIGGVFRKSWAPHGFDATVPGNKRTSRSNARAADRIVVTTMAVGHIRRLLRSAEKSGWRRGMTIEGQRVLRGPVKG